jgi:hypothetical protein
MYKYMSDIPMESRMLIGEKMYFNNQWMTLCLYFKSLFAKFITIAHFSKYNRRFFPLTLATKAKYRRQCVLGQVENQYPSLLHNLSCSLLHISVFLLIRNYVLT